MAMNLDRRGFLAGLFGAAAVAAAGPIPAALEALTEEKFKEVVTQAAAYKSNGPEIWCDGKDYSFTQLQGFRPMREESDRIAAQALNNLFASFRELRRSVPPRSEWPPVKRS
jgi:hypothetical protein